MRFRYPAIGIKLLGIDVVNEQGHYINHNYPWKLNFEQTSFKIHDYSFIVLKGPDPDHERRLRTKAPILYSKELIFCGSSFRSCLNDLIFFNS